MKRVLMSLIIVMTVILNMCIISYANDDIKVSINGNEQLYDQNPVIINGRTLVPMRAIFESLGATVEWNDEEKSVTAKKDFTTIKIGIGKKYATVNDKSVRLDTSASIINSRTLVPVRFVSEALGAQVKWNNEERKVEITYKELLRKNIDFENITSFKDYVIGGGMKAKVSVESGIDHNKKIGSYLSVSGFQTKSHRLKIHGIFPKEYIDQKFVVSMWVMSPDIPVMAVVGAYGDTNSLYATRPTKSNSYEIEAGKWTNIVFEYVSFSEIATMIGIYQDKSNVDISPTLYIDDIEILCTEIVDDENKEETNNEIPESVKNSIENAKFTIDYNFNEDEKVKDKAFAGGANYNTKELLISDVYDVDENGKSLRFGLRKKTDDRLKIANAFSTENIGKKYVVSMWVYIPERSSKLKISTFGITGTEYAYKSVFSKEFYVPKGEWTQLAFEVTHTEPLISMVGIEQAAGEKTVNEIYIDDIKIGVVE